MDIRVLQYFLAVAREGSINGAAEYLHMTQPPLSRQLKELEAELGKQLFIRGNRKITLTEEGMILRKRAEQMIELMDKTEAEITCSNQNISGNIYIGCAESEGMRIICRTIRALREEYPDIHFHMISGHSEPITERLDRGLLDFGVFLEPTNIDKYEFIRLPHKDTWGLLLRKDSPLAKKKTITFDDLLTLPLITSSQDLVSNEFAGWSGGKSEQLNIVATYNLLYNAALMVEEGIGYALCLDKIIPTTAGRPLCFRPLEPALEATISVAWKKYQVFSKAADLFLNRLQQEFLNR